MMSNSLVNKPAAKNLGDLFKMPSNALMLAILRAVDSQQAHKSTGRNQSVSVLFLFFFGLFITLSLMFDCFIYQAPWKNVLELLFKVGAPCENYKKSKCVYEFRKKVVVGMKARYEKVSAKASSNTLSFAGINQLEGHFVVW
jgi:hypothetical protein